MGIELWFVCSVFVLVIFYDRSSDSVRLGLQLSKMSVSQSLIVEFLTVYYYKMRGADCQ